MNVFKFFLVTATIGSIFVSASAFATNTCPSCACYLKKEAWDVARKDTTDANSYLHRAISFQKSTSKTQIKLDSQVRTMSKAVFNIQKDLIKQQAKYDQIRAKDKGYRAEENNTCHGFLGTLDSLTSKSTYRKCISIEKRNAKSNADVQYYKDRIVSINTVYKRQTVFLQQQQALAQQIQNLTLGAQTSAYTTAVSISQQQVAQQQAIYSQSLSRSQSAKDSYFACLDSI